jgi:hypothetical protein
MFRFGKEYSMATKKSESEKKFKPEIPEEAREHYRNARNEMREAAKLLFPAGFLERRRAARKEMMMAFRSMLDSAIEKMDEKE